MLCEYEYIEQNKFDFVVQKFVVVKLVHSIIIYS